MKLISSESPVFMNMSINSVFQILGDDRQASRLPFPIHVKKLVMDFDKAKFFTIKNHRIHLPIGGISG
jgi:hypothetical protein